MKTILNMVFGETHSIFTLTIVLGLGFLLGYGIISIPFFILLYTITLIVGIILSELIK